MQRLEWRLTRLRKAGAFLVALVEAEFQMNHPTARDAGRAIGLDLVLVLERGESGWSVPVREPAPAGAPWSRLPAALAYAVEQHEGQQRKGTAIPYVSHVLAVAASAMEMQPHSDTEPIAALLHDVVEDAGGMERAREIARSFGFDVLRIVLSNRDTVVQPKPPWRERKEAYLAAMVDKEPDELRISLADKLHNARAILQDLRTEGEELWTRFNVSRDEVLWYYRQLTDAFLARPDSLGPAGAAAAAELDRVVTAIADLAAPPA
jgi:GTP pyrophosphokinase